MKYIAFILVLIVFVSFACQSYAIEIPDGAFGVISIPLIGVEMPLYTTDEQHEQDVIDAEESALYYPWQTAYRIVDHAFSDSLGKRGYWDIQKVFSGAYAYLYTVNGNYYYECYMTAKTEYRGDQEFTNGRIITPCSSYDLMVGCCAEDSHHHFVAVFRRLREIP